MFRLRKALQRCVLVTLPYLNLALAKPHSLKAPLYHRPLFPHAPGVGAPIMLLLPTMKDLVPRLALVAVPIRFGMTSQGGNRTPMPRRRLRLKLELNMMWRLICIEATRMTTTHTAPPRPGNETQREIEKTVAEGTSMITNTLANRTAIVMSDPVVETERVVVMKTVDLRTPDRQERRRPNI